MPKDEFDHDDPMELVGVALPYDAQEDMARCFVEEYAMLGISREQMFKFFQDPFYLATHQVYKAKGEAWVKQLIDEVTTDGGGSNGQSV